MSAVLKAPPPPHPKDAFVLGSSLGFQRDIVQTFVDGWREVGDVAWFRTPRPMYVLAHPDHIQHVFEDHHEHHPRSGYVRGMLKNIMGEGLFTSDERLWQRQVGLIKPAYAPERVTGFAGVMTRRTNELLDEWSSKAASGEVVDVQGEMVQLCLDVIGEILFGQDDWARDGDELKEALVVATEWAIPRVTGFPTPVERLAPAYRRYKRAKETVARLANAAIEARRNEARDDLVSTFVQAREDGRGLDDRQLHDAVTSALFGAYKGPPISLMWTWYLLSMHPAPRRRLEAELDQVLGGGAPGVDDLQRLRYTSMVVDEVLRLYPPLWLMSRPPDRAEVIGGYLIPERVYLIAMPYITHRHPDFWPNPEGFEPERFSPERAAGRHPYAYLPFGLAHRMCVADHYSLLQLRLTVAMIAQRYRLNLAPGYQLQRKTEFLMRPTNGMPMTIHPRVPEEMREQAEPAKTAAASG